MAEIVNIATLNIDTGQVLKKSAELRQDIERLRQAQKGLDKTTEEGAAAFAANEVQIKNLSKAYRDNQNFAAALEGANKDLTKVMQVEGKSTQELRDSRAQLNQISQQLLRSNGELTGDIEGERALRKQLNVVIDEQTEALREQSSSFNANKDRVGEYKDSITEAFQELNIFNGGLGGFAQRAQAAGGAGNLFTNAVKGITVGIWGMVKASLAFIATGIGAIIAAVGLATAGLVKGLTSSQEGMDRITKITRPLAAIMDALLGVVQDLSVGLFDAFTNPKKALTDLVDFVKNNVMNRFKAFGVIIEAIQERDFKKLADGIAQGVTGVENLTDKVVDAAKQSAEFLDNAAKTGAEIDRLTKELNKGEGEYIIKKAELGQLFKEQNQMAEDTTLSFEEMEKAAKASIETQKKINKLAEERNQKELQLLNYKFSLSSTSDEEKKELAQKIADLNDANAQALTLITSQTKKVNRIRNQQSAEDSARAKEAEERRRKAVEEGLRQQKEELDLFIAQQGIKAASLEEEIERFRAVSEKRKEILAAELEAGKISETQYATELLNIRNDLLQKQADLAAENAARELERKKQQEEREKEEAQLKLEAEELDYQNRLALEQQRAQDSFERRRLQLEEQRRLEIEAAEKIGADTTLIEQKYANISEQIKKEEANTKLALAGDVFNGLSGILDKESAAGKAVALAQSLINVQQGVTKAIAQGGIAGIATGAIVAAKGAISIGNILNTESPNTPKSNVKTFQGGGILKGKSHAQGGILTPFGELEGNEAVINRVSTRRFAPLLSAINVAGGGRSFAAGISGQNAQANGIINYDLLAAKVAQANSALPNPVVSVVDIAETNSRVEAIDNIASF